MTLKTFACALGIAAALPFVSQTADAQEKNGSLPEPAKKELMAAYPNLSYQGVFANPAYFCQIGDWAYAVATLSNKQQGAFFQVSKKLYGVQMSGSYAQGSYGFIGAFELTNKLMMGTSFSAQNKNGVLGAVYKAAHTPRNLTNLGVQYDTKSRNCRLAGETRQLAFKGWAVTASAQATMNGRNIVDNGIGLQAGNKKYQLSAGLGGKGWKDVTAAARRVVNSGGNRFLIDLRASVPGGRINNASAKVGITYMLR
ncbi:MAG: hypothetical protein WCY41_05935 [Candidatus Micrarchaeia archaeon]